LGRVASTLVKNASTLVKNASTLGRVKP